MRKYVALLLIAAALLTLAACGSKDALAEAWSEPSTYTFSVDGSSLTMNENSGYGISGTFAKK